MYICSQSRFDAVGQNGLGFAILCAREFLLWLCNPACGAGVTESAVVSAWVPIIVSLWAQARLPVAFTAELHYLGHVRERFLTIRCSDREIGDYVNKWQTVDESRQEASFGIDIS